MSEVCPPLPLPLSLRTGQGVQHSEIPHIHTHTPHTSHVHAPHVLMKKSSTSTVELAKEGVAEALARHNANRPKRSMVSVGSLSSISRRMKVDE